MNAAGAGATVNVAAGTYTDGLTVSGKTNLTIAGAGAGTTTIQPTALVSSGLAHKYTSNMQVSALVKAPPA